MKIKNYPGNDGVRSLQTIAAKNEVVSQVSENGIVILIPVYKNAAALETTLNCLTRQISFDRQTTIIVANDGDNSQVTMVCRKNKVAMVATRPRRGSYFARNRALAKANADVVVFLDAGVEVPSGWLSAVLSALGTADYLACAIDIAAVPHPTACEAYEMAHAFPIATYLRNFHFGVTAGLAMKKRVLEAIGSFDERLFSGGDLEFGDRVHRAGFTQAYLGKPVLLHRPRRALSFFKKQFRIRFGHRHLSRFYPDRFPPRSISSLSRGFLKALLPPRPGSLRREFPMAANVPAWRRFFFLWAFKICRATADLLAAVVPSPAPAHTPARVVWQDFSAHGC